MKILRIMIACILICAGNCFYTNAQSGPGTGTGQQSLDVLSLTTVLPPAPNAFEITRYSGLPVNLSTGSVSVSIPLGDVKSGKVDVPISLSYNSGNGVLVNQTASRTGMNWVLSAGGAITRTVYDNPDESATWIPPLSQTEMKQESQGTYDYMDQATSTGTVYDTQTDIFSFNFNGYSGQFYLNPNDKTKVVMLAASNLKVETNFHGEFGTDHWTFRVTDPAGTKYYFGGPQATEKSKTTAYNCGRNFLDPIANAWYLIAVQHYSGEYIWLTYEPCTVDYFADVTQTIIRTPAGTSYYCTGSACSPRNNEQVCLSELRSTGFMLRAINSKFSTARFIYSSRKDMLGDSLLTQIRFYKKDLVDTAMLNQYNQYDLSYVYSNNKTFYNPYADSSILSNRPFLTQVVRSEAGMQPQVHTMNYYNINGLSSRLSFAQDYWGYFNGVNNQNLVPPATDPIISAAFPTNLANRNPDSTYSYYGLLSKITYPTQGSDSLQYEPNTMYVSRAVTPAPTTVTKSVTGTGLDGLGTVSYGFYLFKNQNISLNLSCTYSGQGTYDPKHEFMVATVTDETGNVIFTRQLAMDETYPATINAGPGNFTLKLDAYGLPVTANATLTYQTGTNVLANWQVGGVRVARNISSPVTGLPLTKRYIYAALALQSQSSGKMRIPRDPLQFYPQTYYSMLTDGYVCDSGPFARGTCSYYIAYSAPLAPLNFYSGSPICYTNVIELQDDAWANGGVEHQYHFADPGEDPTKYRGTDIPGVSMSNYGFPIGLETLEQTFVTTGHSDGAYQYSVVKKVATHYVSDTLLNKQVDNYVVRKNYEPGSFSTPPNDGQFQPYDMSGYSIISQWIHPDTVTTTTYDLTGSNPVTSYQYSIYRDTTNLMVSERKTVGSDGILQQNIYKYPHDMVLAGVTTPYQAMINDNDIAPVIEQQYLKNGVLQQAVNTLYGDFGNHVYEPDTIKTKTTGNYDNRIVFNSYNINGGLLSQNKMNGALSSYLWSYNNQFPVAEVKNAAPNEIWYENFEYTGDTTIHHTGNLGHFSAYTVSFTPPPGKSYVISWFQLNGGIWHYYIETYTGFKTFAAGTFIDDVAVYPADAQMSNIAFDPVVGPTGMIDAKGETVFYDYDNYQRLMNIKDKDGNIVKHTDYHYPNN